jgi:hypothetical protein
VDWRARYVEGGVKTLYEDRPRGKSFEAVARSKEAEIVAKTQSAGQRHALELPPYGCDLRCQQSIRVAYLAGQWVKTAPGQDIQTSP